MTLSLLVTRSILAATLFVSAGTTAFAQFETRASTNIGAHIPNSFAVGDFNRDGNLDIAILSYDPVALVMIFLGNGDGTFRASDSYAVAVDPLYATTASLRHNGILDLVVGDLASDNVYVMLGNGDGTFQPAVAYPATGAPENVGTGHFTGSGNLDIIALARIDCNCVEVLPGNGDGTFRAAVVTSIPYSVGGLAMASGDFNGDGKLDVAVSGGFDTTFQVDILLGNGDGSFRADGFYGVSADPISVVGGHFHGGNKVDLAVGNLLDSSVSVLLGDGDGGFERAVEYGTYAPISMSAGDLNGDGREDLVVANYGSASNYLSSSLSVLTGNGDGTFQPGLAYPAGESLNYVAIGDFNGDRKPDLVTVDSLANTIITLLNTGVVTFSPTTPLTFPTQLIGTTSAPQSTTLNNSGTKPLTISSVTYSGESFHMRTTCKGSVAPGASCSITATFTPQAENVTTGTVTIHDSASSKPQFVELVGTGTVVKLIPRQLTFPPQKNGTKSPPQTIVLTNTGSAALDFTSAIRIGGPDPNRDFFESNNCSTSLKAGASCDIHVIFAPRMKGSFSASVVITDSGGGSPQSIPLSGTGD